VFGKQQYSRSASEWLIQVDSSVKICQAGSNPSKASLLPQPNHSQKDIKWGIFPEVKMELFVNLAGS
jgi:hypothetical protein